MRLVSTVPPGTRLRQVCSLTCEPPRRDLELDVATLLEGNEPVACGHPAAGEATDELMLGAYPERAFRQPANLVEPVLPPRRISLVGHEVEDLSDRTRDLDRRLHSDHDAPSESSLATDDAAGRWSFIE